MGFDISGLKARSKKGEYFRNNVWWWRRLWDYVCFVGVGILDKKDFEKGRWNNGEEIDAEKTKKLVEALEQSIKAGVAKEFAAMVRNDIKLAKANNKGKTVGDPGYNWEEAYPFTITNLKEFIAFAKDSGGFIIC